MINSKLNLLIFNINKKFIFTHDLMLNFDFLKNNFHKNHS